MIYQKTALVLDNSNGITIKEWYYPLIKTLNIIDQYLTDENTLIKIFSREHDDCCVCEPQFNQLRDKNGNLKISMYLKNEFDENNENELDKVEQSFTNCTSFDVIFKIANIMEYQMLPHFYADYCITQYSYELELVSIKGK